MDIIDIRSIGRFIRLVGRSLCRLVVHLQAHARSSDPEAERRDLGVVRLSSADERIPIKYIPEERELCLF